MKGYPDKKATEALAAQLERKAVRTDAGFSTPPVSVRLAFAALPEPNGNFCI